jgi:phosphoribosylaminoimidazole-succinocarboxamide synthase
MGSVKDLEIIEKPTKTALGSGRFHFSDRYSVFDWGEMPDHIDCKGEALCLMGAYCFEKLEEKGVRTHYRGVLDEKRRTVTFEELKTPTHIMEVGLVNVYRPQIQKSDSKDLYVYDCFTPSLKNFLIPLEIIYRNGLPEGSSVFKRLKQGKVTIKDLGLDRFPKPGEQLETPIFDVSTKLEETDRYITWEEAKRIAALNDEELEAIRKVLAEVNHTISKIAVQSGLRNEDGKIELAFDDKRTIMVVDVVGTLDECRFTYDSVHVSKEIARQFYKKTVWYRDVEDAKKSASSRGISDWKALCKSQPPKLNAPLKGIISGLYKAAANELTSRRFFDVPSLEEIIKRYEDYVDDKK